MLGGKFKTVMGRVRNNENYGNCRLHAKLDIDSQIGKVLYKQSTVRAGDRVHRLVTVSPR